MSEREITITLKEAYASLEAFLVGHPRAKKGVCGRCSRCGVWRNSLHRDHIIPKAIGGPDELSNIQLLCANCHQDKTCDDMRLVRSGRKSVFDPAALAERNRKISLALKGRPKPPRTEKANGLVGNATRRRWQHATDAEKRAHLERLHLGNAAYWQRRRHQEVVVR